MATVRLPSLYTILIDGDAILSFEAQNLREASELTRERWLLSDLAKARSAGVPLWHEKAKIRARLATPDEAAVYSASTQDPEDDLHLAYLVNLDGDGSADPIKLETVVRWRGRNKFAWSVVDGAGKVLASGLDGSVQSARESAAFARAEAAQRLRAPGKPRLAIKKAGLDRGGKCAP
jgi:hypothetical protein